MTRERDCSQNDDVQGTFDGERPSRDVAGHLVDCNPCGGSLKLIQVQGDALKYLSSDGDDTAIQPVVQRVLTASAKAGREQLADLLYELGAACLILNDEASLRTQRAIEPRPVAAVVKNLGRVHGRIVAADELRRSSEHLLSIPETSKALEAAEGCVMVLENVEGDSSRQQLILSQIRLVSGRFEDATSICKALLTRGLPQDHRAHAYTNLTCALNRIGRYEESLEVATEAMRSHSGHFMLAYNQICTLAMMGRVQDFKQAATHVATLLDGDAPWKSAIICNDTDAFAMKVSLSRGEILRLFGLPTEAVGNN